MHLRKTAKDVCMATDRTRLGKHVKNMTPRPTHITVLCLSITASHDAAGIERKGTSV